MIRRIHKDQAQSLPEEDVQRGPATEKGSTEINIDYLVKILQSKFVGGVLTIDACIVD